VYNPKNLNFYRNDTYSQNGEDGIIEEVLKRLNIDNNLEVVEFGACDGIYLSNTFNLIKKNKVSLAIYIESDLDFFSKLEKNAKIYPCIVPLNNHIEFGSNTKNNLDTILAKTKVKKDFDILSIDIDSYDLDVFLSIKNYKPKVLIIEANRMLKGIFHKHNENIPGNSFSRIIHDVKKKNYIPIVFTGNIFFINSDFIKDMKIFEKFIKEPGLLYDYHDFFYKYKEMNIYTKFLFAHFPINFLKFAYKIKKLFSYK
jgi:hypothetical protein|tara:strand:+ start:174 stop:941 length:768 start_codon:yes stop_codon:yes gene_type:complete